ncbi:enolase C-terminal domain-like protein, partial [Actinomadura oligospora]|uniref:enolase C-terminal domain-like protein n=1 Tax=Actinomadura oligospora TaxID=111804 RepID=UPI0004AFA0CB
MRERGHLVGHQADALAAVDIALWDVAGRLTGRPVSALLGGAFRTEIPVYVSGLPRPTNEERAALAMEWVERGATRVKLHLGHVEGHRDLARRVDLPIAIGETLRNRYELTHWLDRRATGLVQPDVGRTGITELMAMGELAAARHLPVAPHHSTGLGVVLAAGLHASAALSDLAFFEFQPTSHEVGGRVLTTPITGGATGFAVPSGPGLGV